MSLKYRDASGTETPVAGLNGASGELVPSASYYQSGVETVEVSPQSGNTHTVTLNTVMPDADYCVTFTVGAPLPQEVAIRNKTTSQFDIVVLDRTNGTGGYTTVTWQAFKLMDGTPDVTVEMVEDAVENVYGDIIPSRASASNPLVTKSELGVYNEYISMDTTTMLDIKASADAVGDCEKFEGVSQSDIGGSWFGFKKSSSFWTCVFVGGDGNVVKVLFKNGIYTHRIII